MQMGSNAVATPALNEVTSDQGLARRRKQASVEEDNRRAKSFLTQSFDQSTQYPLPNRISVAVLLLSALSQS